MINRENSLLVIIITTFLLSFDKEKGKAPDIFKRIHLHYNKQMFLIQGLYFNNYLDIRF